MEDAPRLRGANGVGMNNRAHVTPEHESEAGGMMEGEGEKAKNWAETEEKQKATTRTMDVGENYTSKKEETEYPRTGQEAERDRTSSVGGRIVTDSAIVQPQAAKKN